MHHDIVVEQADNFARASEKRVSLELGVLSLDHFLGQGCPRIGMDGEDDKDLEWMEAFEGSLVRVSRGNERRKLDEATALQLDAVESWNRLLS